MSVCHPPISRSMLWTHALWRVGILSHKNWPWFGIPFGVDQRAVQNVLHTKKRPLSNPLIVHVTKSKNALKLWAASTSMDCVGLRKMRQIMFYSNSNKNLENKPYLGTLANPSSRVHFHSWYKPILLLLRFSWTILGMPHTIHPPRLWAHLHISSISNLWGWWGGSAKISIFLASSDETTKILDNNNLPP